MTREQQKNLKELKKALPKIIQSEIKKYKLKKKDFMVWYQKEDLFFDLQINIRERGGHCYCGCVERLKPLWLDDLLWELLEMPENKNEPVSLRAIGAFTVYGSEIYRTETELISWETEELEKNVVTYIEHFYQNVHACGIEKFYENMCENPYHQELRTALSLVHDQKYQRAAEYLNARGRGSLCNKGIWINEAIVNYCN